MKTPIALASCFVAALALTQPSAASEILTVSSTTPTPALSSPLGAGIAFLIEVSGIYHNGGGPNVPDVDAEFQKTYLWDWQEYYPGYGETTDVLDLLVNGASINWLGSSDGGATWQPHTFSPNHVYRTYITGAGASVGFMISDLTPFGAEHYTDNSGSLTVEISQVVPELGRGITCLWTLACIGLLRFRRVHIQQPPTEPAA